MNKTIYKRFASVIVKKGINLQEGQDVLLYISTLQREFAKYITMECYKNKARKVIINWTDDDIDYVAYKYGDEKALSKVEDYEEARAKHNSKSIPCRIYVEDSNPEAFNGLDNDKISRISMARRKVIKKYRDITEGYDQWCIVAVPSKEWAKMIFPNETPSNAVKKLWDAIIKTTRIDSNDPIKAWNEHIEYLASKAKVLNELNLDYLEYSSSNGTNLKLKLHEGHLWQSASEKSLRGIEFVANMPTEEVFTMPDINGVDGVVVASKPLSHNGVVIEDFKIWFEHGRVVKCEALKGQNELQKIIDTDEGSHHLGEVALVPYDSPINLSGILFYNTLFDENAACHLALGMAFRDNLKGYETMSDEEFKKIDFNNSLTHVDFMIGTKDLNIVGYDHQGNKHQIFKDGNFAF